MDKQFRILLIDDDKETLSTLEQYLRSNHYVIHSTSSADNVVHDIQTFEPDIVIVDYGHPLQGTELCTFIRNNRKWCYIIVITSEGELTNLTAAFQAGANDFIKKPINTIELGARLSNAAGIVGLIHKHVEHNTEMVRYTNLLELETQNLYEQLMTDHLTKLFSRRFIETLLSRSWISYTRTGATFGLVCIDIDHFKIINDTYGHDVGDEVLRFVSTTILNTVRENDSVGRMGGEEFMIVCSSPTLENLERISEKIRNAVELCQPYHLNLTHKITISVGAAISNAAIDMAWQDTYKRTDLALYSAKSSGRNCCKIYENI